MFRVEIRHFAATAPAFNLPHLYLLPLLGMTRFPFCRKFWHQKSSWARCLRDPAFSRLEY